MIFFLSKISPLNIYSQFQKQNKLKKPSTELIETYRNYTLLSVVSVKMKKKVSTFVNVT